MNQKLLSKRLRQLLIEDSQNEKERQKLFKVATKLEGIIPETDTPTETFRSLSQLGRMQSEYLSNFGLKNILKIAIIIYFKKKNIDETRINKILDSLFFAILFYTDGQEHEEECSQCDGSGSLRCSECYGEGHQECGECDGNGEVECDECEGEGKIEDADGDMIDCDNCGGKGEVDCDNCEGGTVDCNYCGGTGEEECTECGGDGNIQTDEIDYDLIGICSWDPNLKNLLELREREYKPAVESLDNFRKNYLEFSTTSGHAELPSDIEEGEYYSVLLTDNPPAKLLYNLNVSIENPEYLIGFITDEA